MSATAGGGSSLRGGMPNCLPTCDTQDSRFLALASGTDLAQQASTSLELRIGVTAGESFLNLEFFDGESNESGAYRWDSGGTAATRYTLFADPMADGTGQQVVEMESGSPFVMSSSMLDGDWTSYLIPNPGEAQSPSGHFFYRLSIELVGARGFSVNCFKIRANGSIWIVDQAVSLISNFNTIEDLNTIYPNLDVLDGIDASDFTGSTYDGRFQVYYEVPVGQDDFVLWDGDLDHGSFDGSTWDTDDPDTPGSAFLPILALSGAAPEGSNGARPFDDNGSILLQRSPAVDYAVTLPAGGPFRNSNPSGHSEWEQFRIATQGCEPKVADHCAGSIGAGLATLSVRGLDVANLIRLWSPYPMVCEDALGVPCSVLQPFRVSGSVFEDSDGDGSRGSSEPGWAGVVLALSGLGGELLDLTVTDSEGRYTFEVASGSYRIEEIGSDSALTAAQGMELGGSGSRTILVHRDNLQGIDFGLVP